MNCEECKDGIMWVANSMGNMRRMKCNKCGFIKEIERE
jgi:hypothetical protein